jgi:deoxyribose-phosphate aldolase
MNQLSEFTSLVATAIETEQAKGYNKCEVLKTILGLMDLTTLDGTDHEEKVNQLCRKAISLRDSGIGVSSTAAVCVYPVFVATAVKTLEGTGVKVAAVAGGFPSGQMPVHLRVAEVEWAVQQGANEIDMVISRGRMISGDYAFVEKEVAMHKKACGDAHLKVILETGELLQPDLIRKASEIAIASGADFIKTSTGKIQPAATPEASWIMLHAIQSHHITTGNKIGFKPAGGIATAEDAIQYYLLVKHVLGEEWLNPDLFRYGASRLFDQVLNAINDID